MKILIAMMALGFSCGKAGIQDSSIKLRPMNDSPIGSIAHCPKNNEAQHLGLVNK